MTDAEIACVLERAADIIEREGYDPSYYGPDNRYLPSCDGTYCQVGAIAAAQGFKPEGYFDHEPEYPAMRAVCEKLHPDRSGPNADGAADANFQRDRYPNREAVIRHMREVAASLTGAVDVTERERVPA